MSSSECYPERSRKIDALMEILSHNLRREVIHFFENHTTSNAAPLSDVVDHLAGRVPDTDHQTVRVALHHDHLPRLHDSGWLEYDARNTDIHYHGQETAERLLNELVAVFS